MSYAPGENWEHTFVLRNAAGVQTDSENLESPATRRAGPSNNWIGTDDNAVSNGVNPQGNGVYSTHGVIPSSYAVGDIVEINFYYTMDGQTRNEIFHLGPLVAPSTAIRQVSIVNRTIQSR